MQGELERALRELLGEPIKVVGAARTDAGVHATGQVISFRTERATLPVETIRRGANALLSADVALREVAEIGDDFHARYSATGRTYNYRIWNGASRLPLLRRTALWVEDPLDLAAMGLASQHLVGRHDFSAFSMKGRGSAERTVRRASWRSEEASLLVFEIEAEGFLRGMVRGIVGTLLRVGRGKLDEAGFAAVLASADRTRGGPAVAPQGLCLVRVQYGLRERGDEAPYDEDSEGNDE